MQELSPQSFQVIGSQAMITVGNLLFMVRYSPYKLADGIAINGDHQRLSIPPVPLSSVVDAVSLVQENFPRYEREDWEVWQKWSLFPGPGLASVYTNASGEQYVDNLLTASEPPEGYAWE